jgi:hypothetical protein
MTVGTSRIVHRERRGLCGCGEEITETFRLDGLDRPCAYNWQASKSWRPLDHLLSVDTNVMGQLLADDWGGVTKSVVTS